MVDSSGERIHFHAWKMSKVTEEHLQKLHNDDVILAKEIIGWRAAADEKIPSPHTDENTDSEASDIASKLKISSLEEINKKTDETIQRTLTDYIALEQEFEDHKAESQSAIGQREVQLEAMESERHRLCIVVGPVLDKLYPATAGTNADSIDHVTDLLKTVPERLKDLVRERATMGCSQTLSITKSLYPRVEIEALGDGYVAVTTDEDALRLVNEVQDVAKLMVDDVMANW